MASLLLADDALPLLYESDRPPLYSQSGSQLVRKRRGCGSACEVSLVLGEQGAGEDVAEQEHNPNDFIVSTPRGMMRSDKSRA